MHPANSRHPLLRATTSPGDLRPGFSNSLLDDDTSHGNQSTSVSTTNDLRFELQFQSFENLGVDPPWCDSPVTPSSSAHLLEPVNGQGSGKPGRSCSAPWIVLSQGIKNALSSRPAKLDKSSSTPSLHIGYGTCSKPDTACYSKVDAGSVRTPEKLFEEDLRGGGRKKLFGTGDNDRIPRWLLFTAGVGSLNEPPTTFGEQRRRRQSWRDAGRNDRVYFRSKNPEGVVAGGDNHGGGKKVRIADQQPKDEGAAMIDPGRAQGPHGVHPGGVNGPIPGPAGPSSEFMNAPWGSWHAPPHQMPHGTASFSSVPHPPAPVNHPQTQFPPSQGPNVHQGGFSGGGPTGVQPHAQSMHGQGGQPGLAQGLRSGNSSHSSNHIPSSVSTPSHHAGLSTVQSRESSAVRGGSSRPGPMAPPHQAQSNQGGPHVHFQGSTASQQPGYQRGTAPAGGDVAGRSGPRHSGSRQSAASRGAGTAPIVAPDSGASRTSNTVGNGNQRDRQSLQSHGVRSGHTQAPGTGTFSSSHNPSGAASVNGVATHTLPNSQASHSSRTASTDRSARHSSQHGSQHSSALTGSTATHNDGLERVSRENTEQRGGGTSSADRPAQHGSLHNSLHSSAHTNSTATHNDGLQRVTRQNIGQSRSTSLPAANQSSSSGTAPQTRHASLQPNARTSSTASHDGSLGRITRENTQFNRTPDAPAAYRAHPISSSASSYDDGVAGITHGTRNMGLGGNEARRGGTVPPSAWRRTPDTTAGAYGGLGRYGGADAQAVLRRDFADGSGDLRGGSASGSGGGSGDKSCAMASPVPDTGAEPRASRAPEERDRKEAFDPRMLQDCLGDNVPLHIRAQMEDRQLALLAEAAIDKRKTDAKDDGKVPAEKTDAVEEDREPLLNNTHAVRRPRKLRKRRAARPGGQG